MQFNSMEIGTRNDEGEQIIIDGTIYTEGDDYYVNVDSFFEALSQHRKVIEFVGGCHIPACCANGAWTEVTVEAWLWNADHPNSSTLQFHWANIYDAAASMLHIIDQCMKRGEIVWCNQVERVPFYQTQLAVLKSRVESINNAH